MVCISEGFNPDRTALIDAAGILERAAMELYEESRLDPQALLASQVKKCSLAALACEVCSRACLHLMEGPKDKVSSVRRLELRMMVYNWKEMNSAETKS